MARSERTKKLVKRQREIDKELNEKGRVLLNKNCYAKRSKIHGIGVFAARDIKKGAKVIEYIGEKIRKPVTDRRSKPDYVYIFTLNDYYDVDGNVGGNGAQYINHTCDVNCESDILRKKIWILATKKIKKDQELGYDYGYEFEDDYEDHPCKCGSKKCIGYIVAQDDWPKLRKAEKKKSKKKKK